MQLYELFQANTNLRWTNDGDGVDATVQLPDRTYLKLMFRLTSDTGSDWEFVFMRARSGNMSDIRGDKTGMGGEFNLFGIVVSAVRQFISKYKPQVLSFSATSEEDEERPESRAKLYSSLLNRFQDPNYTVQQNRYGNSIEFELIRKNVKVNTVNNSDDELR